MTFKNRLEIIKFNGNFSYTLGIPYETQIQVPVGSVLIVWQVRELGV